jgi:hypothetical protein
MSCKAIKTMPSKGKRLGWTPLNEIKSVVITSKLMQGQKVIPSQYDPYLEGVSSTFLIP